MRKTITKAIKSDKPGDRPSAGSLGKQRWHAPVAKQLDIGLTAGGPMPHVNIDQVTDFDHHSE